MIGIEKLKEDITTIVKIIEKVNKSLEDDKISFTEVIGMAFTLPDLFKIIKGYKQSFQELKDLTEIEVFELVQHFKTEFDIDNDSAEVMVENIIEVIMTVAASLLIHEQVSLRNGN